MEFGFELECFAFVEFAALWHEFEQKFDLLLGVVVVKTAACAACAACSA